MCGSVTFGKIRSLLSVLLLSFITTTGCCAPRSTYVGEGGYIHQPYPLDSSSDQVPLIRGGGRWGLSLGLSDLQLGPQAEEPYPTQRFRRPIRRCTPSWR